MTDTFIYIVTGSALFLAILMAYAQIDAETTMQVTKWLMAFNRGVAWFCKSNYNIAFWIIYSFGYALYRQWGDWPMVMAVGSLSSLIAIVATGWLGNFLDKHGV